MNTHIFLVDTLNSSTQCIFLLVRSFIDPTFCGIFFCGPLQFKCQIFFPILLPHNVTLPSNAFYGGNVACISVGLFFFLFFFTAVHFHFGGRKNFSFSHRRYKKDSALLFCCCYFLSNNPTGHAIYSRNGRVLEMQNFTHMKGGTADVRMDHFVRTKIYWMYR